MTVFWVLQDWHQDSFFVVAPVFLCRQVATHFWVLILVLGQNIYCDTKGSLNCVITVYCVLWVTNFSQLRTTGLHRIWLFTLTSNGLSLFRNSNYDVRTYVLYHFSSTNKRSICRQKKQFLWIVFQMMIYLKCRLTHYCLRFRSSHPWLTEQYTFRGFVHFPHNFPALIF